MMEDIWNTEQPFGINGTLIWYFYICKREVWLMGHSIEPDQENDFIALGRHIHDIFYERKKKEILIDNTIRIDLLQSNKLIGEIKKSSKFLKSARMQLYFYLYYLKSIGIHKEGELLIPEERKKESLVLTEELEKEIESAIYEIKSILQQDKPPKPEKIQYCKHCGYKALCWS